MIQVIIVDDDSQCRQEIRAVLEHSGECVVVGESTTPTEVMAMAHIHHPAIVLLNGDLTACDALEIAWLLGFYDSISPEELLETVRRVSAGEFLFSFYSS